MSDFDKEAEREKLREKYEEDEEEREATEQMSELLLKGATMTNAHCNDCGDPIFRYDGQEFCPTCQKPVDRQGDEANQPDDADAAEAGQAATKGDNIEVTEPSDDATVQFGGQNGATDQTAAPDEPRQTQRDQQQGADVDQPRAGSQQPRAETQSNAVDDQSRQQRNAAPREQQGSARANTAGTQPRRAPSVDPATTGSAPTGSGSEASTASDHLANARVILAQTVEENARRARQADSPRDAREFLDAAREAAETLEATKF